jgi:hypothetical protein
MSVSSSVPTMGVWSRVYPCRQLVSFRGCLAEWNGTFDCYFIFGATYFVAGCPAYALVTGMLFYCVYVACFWLAVTWQTAEGQPP